MSKGKGQLSYSALQQKRFNVCTLKEQILLYKNLSLDLVIGLPLSKKMEKIVLYGLLFLGFCRDRVAF